MSSTRVEKKSGKRKKFEFLLFVYAIITLAKRYPALTRLKPLYERERVTFQGQGDNTKAMEPIGYLKAPIDPEQFAHTQKTMQAHGAQLQKANRDPVDIWWIVFFPAGTKREMQEPQTAVPKYKIHLPDGFSFHFGAGTLNQHGLFTRSPAIFLDALEGMEIDTSKENSLNT